MLKIRVMNISKKELAQDAQEVQGHRLGSEPDLQEDLRPTSTAQFGGEPFGCLVGDYYFDHSPKDVALLGEHGEGRRRGAHARSSPPPSPTLMQHGELAGADRTRAISPRSSARRNTPLGARCAKPRTPLHRPRHAARSWRACPTARRPIPSRSSPSRKTTGGGDHQQIRLDELRLRDGDQHQPLVQALRLVLAHPRRRVGRRGGRTCRCTPSRPTTAAWR